MIVMLTKTHYHSHHHHKYFLTMSSISRALYLFFLGLLALNAWALDTSANIELNASSYFLAEFPAPGLILLAQNKHIDSKTATTAPTNNDSLYTNFKYTESSSYLTTLFNPQNGEDGERLWSQTKGIFVYGFAVVGAIYMLPEDVSNWDKSELGDGALTKKWWDNVRTGPTWDEDDPVINYIGHPYFGGVYYQTARNSGYRVLSHKHVF